MANVKQFYCNATNKYCDGFGKRVSESVNRSVTEHFPRWRICFNSIIILTVTGYGIRSRLCFQTEDFPALLPFRQNYCLFT